MNGAVSRSRLKGLVAVLAIAAAGTALLVATTHGDAARASSLSAVTQSDYSALSGMAAGDASGSAPPSASVGEGNRPIAGSMTEIDVGKANLAVSVGWAIENAPASTTSATDIVGR